MLRASLLNSLAQAFAQLFRTLRSGEESIEQCAEIESGAAYNDWQILALSDLSQHVPRLPSIFTRSDVRSRLHKIQQMMRDHLPFCNSWLGGADFKFPIHGDRVAVHDLAMKLLRES